MKTQEKKAWWRNALGIGVSLFFLWLTFRNFSFDFSSLRNNGRGIGFLLLAVLLSVVPTYFNGLRFKLFFRENKDLYGRMQAFPSFYIGHFYNAVLPGNMGEMVKLYHLNQKYRVPFRTLLTYWVCERFLDAIVFSLLLILPLFTLIDTYVWPGLALLWALIMAGILFVGVSQKWPRLMRLLFRLLPFRKVRLYLYALFIRFLWVLRQFWSDGRIVVFMLAGLAFFGLNILVNYLVFYAAGLPVPLLSIVSLLLVTVISYVVHFLPSAPSSAGVMHYGLYLGLEVMANHYGILVDSDLKDRFVITTVFFHLVYFLSDVCLGGFFIQRERKWLFGAGARAK